MSMSFVGHLRIIWSSVGRCCRGKKRLCIKAVKVVGHNGQVSSETETLFTFLSSIYIINAHLHNFYMSDGN